MFGPSNPYDPAHGSIRDAADYCSAALVSVEEIPHAKGMGEIRGLVHQARTLLEDAMTVAAQWRDAFDYHVQGKRTDF